MLAVLSIYAVDFAINVGMHRIFGGVRVGRGVLMGVQFNPRAGV